MAYGYMAGRHEHVKIISPKERQWAIWYGYMIWDNMDY